MSHSTEDKERFVDGLTERLREAGVDVWYDTLELLPSQDLVDRIFNQGMAQTDVYIPVLSNNSIKSNWVRAELHTAVVMWIEGQCRILPIVLDDVAVPKSLLRAVHVKILNTSSYDPEFSRIMAGVYASEDTAPPALSDRQPPQRRGPRLLPADPPNFVNRERELAQLDRMLSESKDSDSSRIAMLVGQPGVGKSALAAHWSNSVSDEFTDGGLHIDFAPRGSHYAPDISDIMAGLLRDLGVEDGAIPGDLPSLRAAYRRVTESKRLLIVADNVSDAAQIKQAEPVGRGSMVVTTSNQYLGELMLEGAEHLVVQELEPIDAIAMLRTMAGTTRQTDSNEDLGELGEICGELPIALSVCASHLRRHPTWRVRDLIDDIRSADSLLDAMAGTLGDSLGRTFNTAYRSLESDAQRFYRRLGLYPGRTLGTAASAAVTGVAHRDATRMLRELHDAHLITELEPRRYTIHNLITEHMRAVFDQEEQAQGAARQLVENLVDWYYGAVHVADLAIAKQRLRLAIDVEVPSSIGFPVLTTPAEGFEWYMTERHNIVAVMQLAHRHGLLERVWQMAEALWRMFYDRRLVADWEECDRLGIQAAVACGHRDAEARLRSHFARLLSEQGKHEQAKDEMELAINLVADSGNATLRASITEFQGNGALLAGETDDALAALESAHVQMEQLEDERGVAVIDLLLSRVLAQKGRIPAALEKAERCQLESERLGDEVFAARAALERLKILKRARRYDEAVEKLQITTNMLEQCGLKYHLADAYELAAGVLDGQGRSHDATECRRLSFRLFRELGHERADRLETELLGDSR